MSTDLVHHQVWTQPVPAADQFPPGPAVWTGTAVVAFEAGGRHRVVAIDPTTRRFTALPDLPPAIGDPVAVWTGNSLLIWGQGESAQPATGSELQPL